MESHHFYLPFHKTILHPFLCWVFFNIPEMCKLRSYFLGQKQSGFHGLYPVGDSASKTECRFNVI